MLGGAPLQRCLKDSGKKSARRSGGRLAAFHFLDADQAKIRLSAMHIALLSMGYLKRRIFTGFCKGG